MQTSTAKIIIKPKSKTSTSEATGATGVSVGSTSYRNYQDFIFKHNLTKDDIRQPTNTSIKGGKYYIPDEEYSTFLNLYYKDIVSKNGEEFLTEKQRENDGPIAVDIDLKYDYNITQKQYRSTHIDDLVTLYLDELKEIFQFEERVQIPVYIFEKPNVNRLEDKQITKDGIHMIIGIQSDRITQVILRNRILTKLPEIWDGIPIKNTWEDVLDKGISEGHTNWQLYGSNKPNHDKYRLTSLYEIEYDPTDNEMIQEKINIKKFDFDKDFEKLSVRHKGHPSFFFKAKFIPFHEEFKNKNMNKTNAKLIKKLSAAQSNSEINILGIRNQEDLQITVDQFLDMLSPMEYEFQEMYEYVMILPISFYGEGSYLNWMRVGWALSSVSKKLLIVWIAFSARSSTFQFDSIPELCDKWNGFHSEYEGGLTKHSIMYWAREYCPKEYDQIRSNTVGFHLDQSIKSITIKGLSKNEKNIGSGDSDIAFILKQLYKDEFVCASIKYDKWYRFSNHRWVEDECGTTLRKHISGELRNLYRGKTLDMSKVFSEIPNITEEQTKAHEDKVGKVMEVVIKLSRTTDKDHILKEAKELFFDKDIKFLDLLDSDPYLLCFKNGVLDIKNKEFRAGRAEDYISKSTLIDYKKLNRLRDAKIIKEIEDFMAQLFPIEELRKYVWSHLASTLVGTIPNQTMNMYIGVGENGKSILTDLMSQVMGEYKSEAPLSLITQSRQKQGSASPDIVALKGVRYAVMNEPTKGDRINDGAMKELTSGVEPIKGRNLFSAPITFIPQFKLVVCANNFLEVKTQDHGTWRRLRVIDFMSLFTDNPVNDDPDKPYQFKIDRKLKEKFPLWKEVFMAMLVEIVLETQGYVKDCDIVLESSLKYREREDYIAQFIRDKIILEKNGKITKSELTLEFNSWYSSTVGRGGPSAKEVHEYMDKKIGKFKTAASAWTGASIRYERNTNFKVSDEDMEDDTENIDENSL